MPRPLLEAELDRRVARALEPVLSIRAAWLFGSQVEGRATAESDLDLGVYYRQDLDDWGRELARRDVIDALTRELGALGESTDVVDLERAWSDVCFAAISRGRCVLARRDEDRIQIEVRVGRRYDDERPMRELYARAALEVWKS